MGTGGWIGVDLDGTLAEYTGWKGDNHVGPPIQRMLKRVKRWLAKGVEVRIMTARVSVPGEEAEHARGKIQEWCREHLGVVLKVTCVKDYAMVELWDDRAVQVEPNTGRILGRRTRGL